MLLHDKPESSDIRFGHRVVSDWLANKIRKLPPPFRLAITGGLGTGKSTILQEAIDKIRKDKDQTLAVSYVDVWKLDKESVRRSALVRIAKDLIGDPKAETRLRESLYGSFSEASYIRPFRKAIDKVGLAISMALFFGIALIAYLILDSMNGWEREPWWWKTFVSAGISLCSLATNLLAKSFVHIQRTFTRAPMVGAEEFEDGLQSIIDSPELVNKRVIIVFDNIDRASPESTKAILAGISAFFDHSGHDQERKVLIIVPYDPSSLRKMLSEGRPILDDCEKMFDAIIPLPKLTLEDLTDFTYEKLKDTLVDFSYEDETLWNLAFLVSVSPFRSPREIKHIVNQLFSKLTLAECTENGSETRFQSGATLLLGGVVTKEPDTLLKLLICEKIFPEFTEVVVNTGRDLKDAFDPSTENEIFKGHASSENHDELMSFLRASLGIPKSPPSSAAPFLYMKGPDQVLAIPAGHVMTEALNMGDAEKLKKVVSDTGVGAKAVSQRDISSIIGFHRKKYLKNGQLIKNCIRATLGLESIEKFETSLAIELSEVTSLAPDILLQISPTFIEKYTRDAFETTSVQKLWRTMDETFKGALSSESQSIGSVKKWCEEYLAVIFRQPEGLKRPGIAKLPLSLVLSDVVHEALGESYPGSLCTARDIFDSTIFFINEKDATKSDRLREVVSSTWRSVPTFEGAEAAFNEVVSLWQKTCDKWLNESSVNETSDKLSTVIFFWPKADPIGTKALQAIRDWIAQRVGPFQSKANQNSAEVLDILLSLNVAGFGDDGNIDSIIQHSVNALTREKLLQLRRSFSDPVENIWKPLTTRARGQVVPLIERTKSFDLIIEDKASDLIQRFIQDYANVMAKVELLTALLDVDLVSETMDPLFGQFQQTNGPARELFIKLAGKKCQNSSVIIRSTSEFALNPDGSNDKVLAAARDLPLEPKIKICETAVDHLMSIQSPWSDKESDTFLWTTLSADYLTDLKLKEIVERALDKGVQNGSSQHCKTVCTKVILELWKQNYGFTEKSFKILKRTADSKFNSEIEEIANKYSVLETLADKATELAGKILK